MDTNHPASCAKCHRSNPPDMDHVLSRLDDLIDFEKSGDRWDTVTALMQVRDWIAGLSAA